jgi:hypothetical protein
MPGLLQRRECGRARYGAFSEGNCHAIKTDRAQQRIVHRSEALREPESVPAQFLHRVNGR